MKNGRHGQSSGDTLKMLILCVEDL